MQKKKTDKNGRILGRRLARELEGMELEQASGSVSTWTTVNPPDGPYSDTGSGKGYAYA